MLDPSLDSPATLTSDPARPGHEYVVVARRYRPQGFQELVGQDQVATALSNAITTNRIGHAYLFTGARGVGKTSTARIFAKALNCQTGPTPNPCNQCDICESIAAGGDVDVLEIDGASNRRIDEMRELRSTINSRPSRARFKIYIIDEVHMLTTEAFNALLKTLEEPPEHAKFIFCTTNPEKMPITVLSRCQRFDFLPVEINAILERLQFILQSEGRVADDDALRMIARRAAGSMRDSQSLIEQMLSATTERITTDDIHRLLGTARTGRLTDIGRRLLARDTLGVLTAVNIALHEGVDPGQLGEQLVGYFRDAMAVAVGGDAQLLLTCDPADWVDLKQLADQAGIEGLLAMFQILDQCVVRMSDSHYARMLLEIALVRVCQLENLAHITELIDQLRAGQPLQRPVAVSGPAVSASAVSASAVSGPAVSGPAVPGVAPSSGNPTTGNQKKTADLGASPLATPDSAAESPISPAAVASAEPTTNAMNVPAVAAAATVPAAAALAVPAALPAAATATPAATTLPSASPVLEAARLWSQALDQLEDMTADYARAAQRVRWSDGDRLIVTFGADGSLQKQSCERGDRRQKLEVALQNVAGRGVRLEFELLVATAPAQGPRKPAAATRVQRLREIERHPFIMHAKSIFEGEIVDIAEPRVVESRSAEASGAESQT